MIYEMRRNPEPTLLLTQWVFNNLPRHIGMVWEELAFDDVIYSGEMDCSTATYYGSDGIHTPVPNHVP